MNQDEKIQYWLGLSDYDLETASAMLNTKRYLYVGFMCHQAIEKVLKAYFVFSVNETPPFTHNLAYLSMKAGLEPLLDEYWHDIMDDLDPLHIQARYPDSGERLKMEMTEQRCTELLNSSRNLQSWIKSKLSRK